MVRIPNSHPSFLLGRNRSFRFHANYAEPQEKRRQAAAESLRFEQLRHVWDGPLAQMGGAYLISLGPKGHKAPIVPNEQRGRARLCPIQHGIFVELCGAKAFFISYLAGSGGSSSAFDFVNKTFATC